MIKTIGRGGAFVAALLMAALAAHAEDKSYDIKLVRPSKVGDKFVETYALDIVRSAKAEVDEKEVSNETEKAKYTLEGELTVNAIDKFGRESSASFVVKKFQGQENGEEKELVPIGTELQLTFNEKEVAISRKDGTLTEGQIKTLQQIFQPRSEQTDDDMFGTKEKKKVGDTWTPNFEAMAKNITEGATVDPKKMKGNMKLAAVKTLGNEPALQITGLIEMSGMNIPNIGDAKEAKITADLEGLSPVDPASKSMQLKGKMKAHAIFEATQENKTMKLTIDATENREATRFEKK